MKKNNINDVVFQVYYELTSKNNQKKRLKFKTLIKILKYIKTKTFFKRRKAAQQLLKLNEFQETKKQICCKEKFVVYTVISGSYDEIKDPIYVDDNIEYIIFTNETVPCNSIWKKIEISSIDYIKSWSSLEQARYIKTHPHEFFKNYKYSLYIDGNIQITCDISPLFLTLIDKNKSIAIHKHQNRNCIFEEAKYVYVLGKAKPKEISKQIKYYKKEGFPKNFGLFETNIIIRKHNDKECIEIMEEWWNQISHYTKRDQLSLTYVLWKKGVNQEFIMSLGNNSRRNPYFIVRDHN